MRTPVLLLFLLTVTSSYTKTAENYVPKIQRFYVSTMLHQVFELVRDIIKNGSQEKGVPALDPYSFKKLQLSYPGEIISFDAIISKGIFSGLGKFEVVKCDFNEVEVSIEMQINFPSLKFESEFYNMMGSIYEAVPLSGNGMIYVEIQNMMLTTKIYLKNSYDSKSIVIDKHENTRFSIEKIKSHTEIDGNIDEIFNTMVEDLISDYINRFNKYIIATYGESVINVINSMIVNFMGWRIMPNFN